jgi:hypothetical protein
MRPATSFSEKLYAFAPQISQRKGSIAALFRAFERILVGQKNSLLFVTPNVTGIGD